MRQEKIWTHFFFLLWTCRMNFSCAITKPSQVVSYAHFHQNITSLSLSLDSISLVIDIFSAWSPSLFFGHQRIDTGQVYKAETKHKTARERLCRLCFFQGFFNWARDTFSTVTTRWVFLLKKKKKKIQEIAHYTNCQTTIQTNNSTK